MGHRELLHQWKPAGSEGLQGGDAVVVQVQLSEEDLVAEPGRLVDGVHMSVNSQKVGGHTNLVLLLRRPHPSLSAVSVLL